MAPNDNRPIRYSRGFNNLGKAKNKDTRWSDFRKFFSNPKVTPETVAQYQKLDDLKQKELKNAAGWWFRAHTEDGKRRKRTGLPCDVVSLDFDAVTPEFYRACRDGTLDIPWEYFIHTTRSHTPGKPRFRMVILLAKPVENADYDAVSRIIASRIDQGLRNVDKVSFRPAQMMYMPTRSSDGEFVFAHHEGEAVDWEDEVEQWALTNGDWHSFDNLPTCPGEARHQAADKAEDPREKRGWVGAFCRAFTIYDCMEKFIPDAYVPGTVEDRFSYTGGHSADGAIVYDDGLYLYSHHGSDPASDKLVNAFDLVRLHLFGELDEDKGWDEKDGPITEAPSYKAMIDFIKDDDAVRLEKTQDSVPDEDAILALLPDAEEIEEAEELHDAEHDPEIELLAGMHVNGTIYPVPIELNEQQQPIRTKLRKRRPRPPKEWKTGLDFDPNGGLKKTLNNAVRITINDLRTRDSIGFNEFENRPVLIRPLHVLVDGIEEEPVHNKLSGDPWQDYHDNMIRLMMGDETTKGYRTQFAKQDIQDAVLTAGRNNRFNPVRETLESFTWDGLARAETLFIRYLGCPDQPYYREAARNFLIAAVARVFEPGCKFDYVPVLFGPQGVRKSTFIKVLALHWFGELKANFKEEQKLVEQMIGHWIMELPELSGLQRSEIEDAKSFISGTESFVRMAYGRHPTLFKRQQVFMGSTNDADFLRDETGNRRFWPIPVLVASIDTPALQAEIALIWAEAVQWYRDMRAAQPEGELPLFLRSPEAQDMAARSQEKARRFTDTDLVAEVLEQALDVAKMDQLSGKAERRHRVTTMELVEIVSQSDVRISGSVTTLVGKAMAKIGWMVSRKNEKNGSKTRFYQPSREVLDRWKREDQAATIDMKDLV